MYGVSHLDHFTYVLLAELLILNHSTVCSH